MGDHFMGRDLTIMLTHLDHAKTEVVVGFGSQTRTFQVEGFINFWVDLVNVGHKAADRRSNLTAHSDSVGQDKRPRAYRLNRHALTIVKCEYRVDAISSFGRSKGPQEYS